MAITGDIKLANNFQLNSAIPLDCKTLVPAVADLANIPAPYVGLTTYIISLGYVAVLKQLPASDFENWERVGGQSTQKQRLTVNTAGQTIFNLGFGVSSVYSLHVNGLQMADDDYTLSANVLTFLETGFTLDPTDHLLLTYYE